MPMSEYRRFVSYFYEYIDGRKQKNAGFAKVELRNGMWRILLRLTEGPGSGSSVHVYGFVRESERLLGILLGEIRPVQQIAEEWAFRADAPVGGGSYGLDDLAGIWIESSDGRRFITVWDDEELETGRFVTEASTETPDIGENGPGEQDMSELSEVGEDDSGERETPEISDDGEDASGEQGTPEISGTGEDVSGEAGMFDLEEGVSRQSETLGIGEDISQEEGSLATADVGAGQGCPKADGPIQGCSKTDMSRQEYPEADRSTQECPETDRPGQECPETNMTTQECPETDRSGPENAVIDEIFRKRTSFQPFSDGEINRCVMILPCDIVRMQQENWNVGRSSFLQHGFYQYRHLLLGKDAKGVYLLGVPGVRNPQETYMARMFGYEQFRESSRRDCGQIFGYWCRELEHT